MQYSAVGSMWAELNEGKSLIECETRGGFRASFGRGDPCTR
jgi:hypothetical protein